MSDEKSVDRQPIDEAYAFDPTDPEEAKDFDRMSRIRGERPVCRPADNLVLTTRFADTARGFKDAKRYSSVGDMRAPGVVVPVEESFLGELDAPLHPRIRRILLKGFTRSRATEAEPWTRAEVKRRLSEVVERGEGDLMAALGVPLPGSVSAHVLGIPDALHDEVMGWCNDLLHSTWPMTGETDDGQGIEACFPELAACLDGLIRERAEAGSQAPDDLLTLMVQTETEDGWSIGAHHTRTLVVNILAGSLSASFMLGNLLYRILTDADFAQALRDDASLIPKAVEESLRLEAPVTFLMRTAREDGELGGCPIHQGEHMMLHIGAANRDPEVYPDPEAFRLDREDAPEHLAFGVGPHICLGNHLTRLVGRVVLEEFLSISAERDVTLAPGFAWECVNHLQEYGPERLDVVVR
ncbi:MAG: cytochrome P450 [Myxococcota bacterium]